MGIGLQSGFVIGVVIAALLLADRLGGTTALALRGAQLALALALVMLVIATTATIAGPFEPALDPFEPSEREFRDAAAEFARLDSVVGTVHAAVAVTFVALGAGLVRRSRALAPAVLVAGVLLLLAAVPDAWPGAYAAPIYSPVVAWASGAGGEAGDARNLARLAVLAAGVVVLAVVIHLRWERRSSDAGAEAADSGAPAP